MKGNTQKIISTILVLALVMGCFVTALTPKANAATTLPELTGQVPSSAKEFNADGKSVNGLNGPVILWWDYHPETQNGDVWMLVASKSAGKIGTAAQLGGHTGFVIDGVEKGDADNVAYTLIMFKNIWLTGDEDFDVSMNKDGSFKGGQWISGNLADYFPALHAIHYYDGDVHIASIPYLSNEKATIMDDKDLPISPTGYEFLGWSYEKRVTEPDFVAGDKLTVGDADIYLYAVWGEDHSQTKTLRYTVEYYVAGDLQVGDTITVTSNVWINDPDTLTVEPVDTSAKKYTGYMFDSTNPTPIPTTIDAGSVIKVYYVKDSAWTKELSYTVEYYVAGDLQVGDTITVTSNVWINDPDTLTVRQVDARTDKYLGYELEKTDPTVIPVTIANGGVIKVYYIRSLFDVTFQPGTYGDFNEYTIKIHSGDTPTPTTPFAKFGYKFIGWQNYDNKEEIYYAEDYTKPLEVELPPVYADVTYVALWDFVNPDVVFPDKIPSVEHFDRWWADYGIICFAASTTKDDSYTLMFADWFFDVYKSVNIGFGSPGKMDYEIRFTASTETDDVIVVTLWQKTGNTWKPITNKGEINCVDMICIRDGHYFTKDKNHNYGYDFGMNRDDDGNLLTPAYLQGATFTNPFGSGAKLAWLY